MEGVLFVICVTYLTMPNTERMMMMKNKTDCSFKNEFVWHVVRGDLQVEFCHKFVGK
jgi:hypothetical protein